jgi:hypothetical protein
LTRKNVPGNKALVATKLEIPKSWRISNESAGIPPSDQINHAAFLWLAKRFPSNSLILKHLPAFSLRDLIALFWITKIAQLNLPSFQALPNKI